MALVSSQTSHSIDIYGIIVDTFVVNFANVKTALVSSPTSHSTDIWLMSAKTGVSK
jgi:hypothetical protein